MTTLPRRFFTSRHGMLASRSLSMPSMCYPCLRTPVTHLSGPYTAPGNDNGRCGSRAADVVRCAATPFHRRPRASGDPVFREGAKGQDGASAFHRWRPRCTAINDTEYWVARSKPGDDNGVCGSRARGARSDRVSGPVEGQAAARPHLLVVTTRTAPDAGNDACCRMRFMRPRCRDITPSLRHIKVAMAGRWNG